jgi:hypothetical protein
MLDHYTTAPNCGWRASECWVAFIAASRMIPDRLHSVKHLGGQFLNFWYFPRICPCCGSEYPLGDRRYVAVAIMKLSVAEWNQYG